MNTNDIFVNTWVSLKIIIFDISWCNCDQFFSDAYITQIEVQDLFIMQ
jgi:hypothetical protein